VSLSILQDARLYEVLHRLDVDLAQTVRALGCHYCDGALHSAHYARKPRGGPPGLAAKIDQRFSFCCARDGCRRRMTPPSVRFLGRRVYFGAVVLLASALRDGLTARRVEALREQLGVDVRTLRRWRRWWQEVFVESAFWRAARARFTPPLAESALPGALLERFTAETSRGVLVQTLQFLAPISQGD
jgi:hypothetical protein